MTEDRSDDPYCGKHGQRFDPAVGCPGCLAEVHTVRHYSPAIQAMMISGAWDAADPFGSGMEMGWSLGIVGLAVGNPKPAQTLRIQPAPTVPIYTLDKIIAAPEDDDNVSLVMGDLATAVKAGEVSEDDLTFAARVVQRYVALCIRAGEDY